MEDIGRLLVECAIALALAWATARAIAFASLVASFCHADFSLMIY